MKKKYNSEEERKEAKSIANKLRYEKNKEKIKLNNSKWLEKNKDKKNEYNKNYYNENIDKIKQNTKEYSVINKVILKIKAKEYRKINKEIILLKYRERIKNDALFKLKHDIRNLIRMSLKIKSLTKKSRTHDILGCSYEEFKSYLESKFESWMTWKNKGNWNGIPTEINTAWDIDHIIPISTAKTEDDVIRLSHYTNLQPLCSYTNRNIKRDK